MAMIVITMMDYYMSEWLSATKRDTPLPSAAAPRPGPNPARDWPKRRASERSWISPKCSRAKKYTKFQ